MTSRILAIAVDCPSGQVSALEEFWRAALGHQVARRWTDPKGVEYTELAGDGPTLLLQPVTEPKRGKNRLHLDLVPDGDRDAEVERLTGLGARVVDADPALPWVVCADPAGNEFCVLPPR
ncbi:VOC family protein [Saccharothrix sp. S26]|uniref:VOC family protein n=1 Tax=Saccharothrix sp. S26 TaxID=2907215 RepID=UPI001F27FC52|nr:VOC family protein [Saccharothrix sp. S26]MCE6995972.1 VOC family protein [Saccharothrix sp. S26]